MKYRTSIAILTVFLTQIGTVSLSAWELGEKLDVQTLDGYLFRGAELMSVHDGGISICYTNMRGEPVLRGITFDRLPIELRLRYGYDPEKFAAYRKVVGSYTPPEPPAPKQPVGPAQPAPSPAKAKPKQNDDAPGINASLTVAPWDWYYPRHRYIFRPGGRRPINPGYRPGPPRPPRPPKPSGIRPGTGRPGRPGR